VSHTLTRWERLHTPERVEIATQIATLALELEETTGKPVIFKTKFGISRAIGVPEPEVANSLYLASTAEFEEEHGFMFVLPGSGRSGEIHGYILQHDRSQAASHETRVTVHDAGSRLADHLRGRAANWARIRVAHGGNTAVGKVAGKYAEVLVGAAAMVESTLESDL
jgi:hypothetical protein